MVFFFFFNCVAVQPENIYIYELPDKIVKCSYILINCDFKIMGFGENWMFIMYVSTFLLHVL